jgi:hypothetical protein
LQGTAALRRRVRRKLSAVGSKNRLLSPAEQNQRTGDFSVPKNVAIAAPAVRRKEAF